MSAAAACLLLAVGSAQSQVINFDVPGATGETSLFGGGTYNLGVNYLGQGALSDPGNDYWNPVVFSGTTSGGLLSDGVTSSSITLSEVGLGGVYAGNNYGANVTQGTPPALFTPFGYAGGGSTVTLTLNNVASGTYNLYLYGQNGSDSSPNFDAFTVGATTLDTSAHGAGISSFFANLNFVEFTGIAPSAGSVVITLTSPGECDFNGLQLQVAPVPEPGTYVLAGVGLISLVGLRSLKRRQRAS